MTEDVKLKPKRYIPPNNIAKLRLQHGWSQEALGRKLGMKGPNVDRLEDGQRRLDTGLLLKLCEVFDVSVDKVTNLPVPKLDLAKVDPTLLGLVVGWLMEACAEHRIEYEGKQFGKWTSYLYNDICERDLNFDEARSLTIKFAKLQKPTNRL